jgi:hypothetical protein
MIHQLREDFGSQQEMHARKITALTLELSELRLKVVDLQ